MNKRLLLMVTLFAAALAAPASLWTFSGTANAAVTVCGSCADIGAPAGPLTHIWIGQDFSCQVQHTGDSVFSMYPEDNQSGDCSTVVKVGGTTYGVATRASGHR